MCIDLIFTTLTYLTYSTQCQKVAKRLIDNIASRNVKQRMESHDGDTEQQLRILEEIEGKLMRKKIYGTKYDLFATTSFSVQFAITKCFNEANTKP